MTGPVLHLSGADLARIEAAAQSGLPRESCGLLLGEPVQEGWRVTGIEESRNIAPPDRHDRFEVDPALLLRIQKSARAGGARMIGVYHSHPGGGAEPSPTDLAAAWQTGMIWLITGLEKDRAETRAWLRQETGFAPVRLRITETTP